ncbi:MAG: FecR domain-containing protein [Leptospiraceae bacterium]|nr:FecR domain-containing protein [Leptospiraceae bacterium]
MDRDLNMHKQTRRRLRLPGSAARLRVLCAISSGIWLACSTEPRQAIGNITYIHGKVMLQSITADNKVESEATAGKKVFPEDQIRTGPDSAAELQIRQYGLLRVGENTVFKLSELDGGNRVEVRVDEGKAGLFINKLPPEQELIVTTPTIIAGVRGTRLLVTNGTEQDSKVALFDGAIELSQSSGTKVVLDKPGEVKLKAGEKLQADSVQPLSAETLAEMNALESMDALQSPDQPKIERNEPRPIAPGTIE